MKHKMMLLALAVVSAAVFALPAMASAAEWDIDSESGALPTFTSSGGVAKLTANGFGAFLPIECTTNKGSGKYTTQTTGTVEFTFEGCHQGEPKCTTAGQASGVITTTEMVFHNIMIDNTAQVAGGTPGLLITPNAAHFATFVCNGGTYTVGGNGIIGDISSPKCGGAFSKTSTVSFQAVSSGVQKYMQEETGATNATKYDLSVKSPLGTFTSAEEASGTVTFNQGTKMTCP
jgi:hypothetical protein